MFITLACFPYIQYACPHLFRLSYTGYIYNLYVYVPLPCLSMDSPVRAYSHPVSSLRRGMCQFPFLFPRVLRISLFAQLAPIPLLTCGTRFQISPLTAVLLIHERRDVGLQRVPVRVLASSIRLVQGLHVLDAA